MKSLAVEDARARILRCAAPAGSETVPLDRALGRVLAEDIRAGRDQPPFDASAMDGWAVRSQDKGPFRIVGESAAGGGYAAALFQGEAVRIFTGAPVPDGADAVVIQEKASVQDSTVSFEARPGPGDNIRRKGGDFAASDLLLPRGARLDPWRISLAAAAGACRLQVSHGPRVAVLSTGEEIVSPGAEPGPWQIFNSGGPAIAALATAWGASAATPEPEGDEIEAIERSVRRLDCDVVVTIGGASVGDHDLVKPALERLGLRYEVQSVNMRPGKPMWFGVLEDGRRVLGLPGNPASAMVCAELFLRPLLLHMQGADPTLPMTTARLGAALPANGPREHWMRVRLTTQNGMVTAHPSTNQDSSLVSVFARADALLKVPSFRPAQAEGTVVDILPMARA